ncbi:unnamed protein product [Closterium sp. Yama58-4]|nr:unnamed protein product [Closterium sp. Yama58-4]
MNRDSSVTRLLIFRHRQTTRCDLDSSPSETETVTTKALRLVVPLVGLAALAAGVRANWRFFSSERFLTILAKLIGYIIVTASTVVKLPQIVRIVRSRSIEGLSVPAFELECVGYTVSLLFCWTRRVPFSAYGELLFLVLQSVILMLLIYYHSPRLGRQRYLRTGIYMGMVAFLLSPAMRPHWFEALYNGQTAVFTLSRLPQMWENFVSSGTGQLSLTTSAMSAAGCAARFFTSIQEKAPFSMVIASSAGFLTNGFLVAQILAYSKPAIQPTQQTAADTTKQAALAGNPAVDLPSTASE